MAFGCRRSVGTLSRSMLVTCERLLSPTLICSRASAKVRFQGRPVTRQENRHRLLWVGSGSSIFALERPLRCIDLTFRLGASFGCRWAPSCRAQGRPPAPSLRHVGVPPATAPGLPCSKSAPATAPSVHTASDRGLHARCSLLGLSVDDFPTPARPGQPSHPGEAKSAQNPGLLDRDRTHRTQEWKSAAGARSPRQHVFRPSRPGIRIEDVRLAHPDTACASDRTGETAPGSRQR